MVLVVDDNRDAAESLGMFLKLCDLPAVVAFDGYEAIEAMEKIRPQAVLLDISMPGLSGLQVATWVRSKPWGCAVRLIAMTGRDQLEDRQMTADAGFDRHIVKPVDPGEVLAELKYLRTG
jgi:DNA-binding response OmpR family regulator